jgi:glycosyltransferase involved in cell wall biosynthesis
MDIFVSSSRWEGLPTVIMESMAAGTPVVATAIPGNMDLIEEGVNGWLAPVEDAQALAQAILSALKSPATRKAFALNSRKRVKSYGIQWVARQYEGLYDELARR